MKRLFALVCALFLLSVPGFAHSGKTDGKGGHYNRSTGEYHFHHGYSAHQHPDGVCPYDFKDKTDHSSGTSAKTTPTPKPTKLRNSAFDQFFYCNGHPRHRHKDGVCPWAEIDAAPKPTTTLEPTKKKSSGSDDVLLKIGVAAGYIFLMFVLPLILPSRNNRKR